MNVKTTLHQFDKFLHSKGLTFEAVVIGAAALAVMDVISRETVDVDCLDPVVPEEIIKAAVEFSRTHPEHNLTDQWINNGPEDLKKDLPKNWRNRIQTIYEGTSLKLSTLGRPDLLKSKLFAFCDRGDDLNDCLALKPTEVELDECRDWVQKRDANPKWPDHVLESFNLLKKRLGYAKK